MRPVGKKGWVVLTRDKHIGKHPLEKRAIIDNKLGYVVFASRSNLGNQGWGELLARVKVKLFEFIRNHNRPFAVSILSDGQLHEIPL